MSKTEEETIQPIREIDVNKYTLESLKFVYGEATKHFDAITEGIRQVTAKSYLAIGVYFTLMSYCFAQLVTSDTKIQTVLSISIFILMIVPSLFLLQNVMPIKLVIPGTEPFKLIHEYFEYDIKVQHKEYLASKINSINGDIIFNKNALKRRAKNLKYSLMTSFAILFFGLCCFWFWNA